MGKESISTAPHLQLKIFLRHSVKGSNFLNAFLTAQGQTISCLFNIHEHFFEAYSEVIH